MAMTELRVRDVGRLAHPADRPARPDRQLPRSGQPPGAGVVLPARPVLPVERARGVRARARQRRDQQRRRRPVRVDRPPPGRARRGGRVRCDRRSRRARLRHDRADPPVEPVLPGAALALVLVAAWSVLVGDYWMAIVVVVAGSIAAQTHVPYLLNAIAMSVLVLGVDGVADAPAGRTTHGHAPAARHARHRRRDLGAAVRRSADPRSWQHPHAGPALRQRSARAGDRASARACGCSSATSTRRRRCRPVPPRRRLRAPLRVCRAATAMLGAWCSSLWIAAAVVAHEAGTRR